MRFTKDMRHPAFVPPYLLRSLAKSDSAASTEAARTLRMDASFRKQRAARPETSELPKRPSVAAAGPHRTIYDAKNRQTLPGDQVRAEGEPPTDDPAADEAYDGLGATWQLFFDVFGRDSLDGEGEALLGTWELSGTNSGNATETNWSLVDTLPAGFTEFTLYPKYDATYEPISGVKSPVTYSYVDASGATVVLGTFTPPSPLTGNYAPTYTIPGTAKKIIMTADSLAPGSYLYYHLKAVVPSDAAVGTTYKNCDQVTGDSLGTAGSNTSCVTTTVAAPFSQLFIYKNSYFTDSGATSQQPGDTFWYTIAVRKLSGKNLTTVDVTDNLPAAFELTGQYCASTGANTSSPSNTVYSQIASSCTIALAAPTVTAQTDGMSLLQWLDLAVPTAAQDGSKYFTLAFQVRVKEGTSIANYTNVAHVNNSDPALNTTCSTSFNNTTVTDASDWNANGSTTDSLCTHSSTVQVRQAAIASTTKWVQGDVGVNVFESTGTTTPGSSDSVTACPDAFGGYTRYPCVAEVNPLGTFNYKFDSVNSGNLPLTNYTFYDILPHIGDVGVNQALADSARKSDWTPLLTGPFTPENAPANANFTVLYSLSYDPCRPELATPTPGTNWQGASCSNPTGGTNARNTWYTQAQIEAMAGSWANVKSVKVDMFTGVSATADAWQPGTHIYFNAPMTAPQNAPASSIPGVNAGGLDLSTAWNSFADQVSGLSVTGELVPQQPAAPRKVGIIVPAKPQVQVGDYVWVDDNKDGLQDSTDKPLPGVVLTLTGPDGQPVTDVFGNPVGAQTTDASGYYLFPNLPVLSAGQHYTVTIDQAASASALAGYAPTTPNVGSDTAKDSSTWTADSGELTADGQKDLTLDFGFIEMPKNIDLTIEKSVTSSGPYALGSTVTYQLTPKNNGPATAAAGWSVTDLLPDGMEIQSITGSTSHYTCDEAAATCTNDATFAKDADMGTITVTAKITVR